MGAGGYSDKDLGDNKVVVSFLTARPGFVHETYTLYRCAEITQERGFDGFVLREASSFQVPGPFGYTAKARVLMEMYQRKSPGALVIEKDNINGGTLFIKDTYFDAGELKKAFEKEIKRE